MEPPCCFDAWTNDLRRQRESNPPRSAAGSAEDSSDDPPIPVSRNGRLVIRQWRTWFSTLDSTSA
jgi:hypothetical protein